MVPPSSIRIPRVRTYSGYCRPALNFVYEALTPSGYASQRIQLSITVTYAVHYPVRISTHGLAYSAFARHYLRNLG